MYNQNQMCEAPRQAESSGTSPRMVLYTKPPSRWRSTCRFLWQAAVGGMIGGYALGLGAAIYNHKNPYNFVLIIFMPFYLAAGAVMGMLTSLLTALFENLIEENLSMLPRAIIASAIAILLIAAIASFWNHWDWQLVKMCILPGAAFGFPIGLITRSKLRLWRLLAHGATESTDAGTSANLPAASFSSFLSVIAGLALRLVGVVGLLVAVMVLACCWSFQQVDERLVNTYAIYYFACTIYVSLYVRSRWAIGAAGSFLNGLLLILALFWDDAAVPGEPGALMVACVVFVFLWLLFLGVRPRPARRRDFATLHPAH